MPTDAIRLDPFQTIVNVNWPTGKKLLQFTAFTSNFPDVVAEAVINHNGISLSVPSVSPHNASTGKLPQSFFGSNAFTMEWHGSTSQTPPFFGQEFLFIMATMYDPTGLTVLNVAESDAFINASGAFDQPVYKRFLHVDFLASTLVWS